MHRLKSVIETSIALVILAGFEGGAASAQAAGQAASTCPAQEVSLYFEKDKAEFNKFSQALVQRVADEAKACGARQVIAQTPVDKAHADAVSKVFQSVGLSVVLAPAHPVAQDDMAARSVLVKLS
ncbi:MAG TPA: hypothetical protein VG942_01090 [Hyphomonadaceae bacterium]|nr:hypothetical protein [Hyphomonadaceae bacterium]